MKAVIDRLEGGKAVLELEGGGAAALPAGMLPAGAREGDVLVLTLEIDRAETERRRKRIEKKMGDLWLD